MTRDRGTPDRYPKPKPTHRVPRKLPGSRAPVPPYRPATNPFAAPPSSDLAQSGVDREPTAPYAAKDRYIDPRIAPHTDPLPPPIPDSTLYPPPPSPRRRRRKPMQLPKLRFPTSWQFWAIAAVITCSGIGGLSIALLLKLPALPNCPSIFWPTASGSLRLYCAQLAANKQSVQDLLEAIALVNDLPSDHPLRPEANRNIETWATLILNLADQAFDRGDLTAAIDTANKIPANTSAHRLVEERVQRWKSIWSKAETIYRKAEEAIQKQDLRAAFDIAVQLLYVGNTYWKVTKYQELNHLIEVARVEGGKLSNASRLIRRGGLANLLAAVKVLEVIKSDSPAYREVQRMIAQIGQAMLDLAEAQLNRRNAQNALEIIRQIPDRAGLQKESQDLTILASAQEQAWGGTASDLETAIVQAQRLEPGRPLYRKAQRLIDRWQLEIQDVSHLDMARQLASSGDLAAAIAEARQIPPSNPRGDEAEGEIADWTAQIQTTEDRPTLNQAEQLARSGDITSLQAAINQAGRIQEGRALSREARGLVRQWTGEIQRIQDQPYLDRARQLAAAGDLEGAIATAQQIAAGRTLHDDAQTAMRQWRNQSEGDSRMHQAYDFAGIGTATMLLTAIRTADEVPADIPARAEADRMINVWSQEILRIAEQEAGYDLQRAIATAQMIPPRTEAYAAAQLNIQTWQQPQPPASN